MSSGARTLRNGCVRYGTLAICIMLAASSQCLVLKAAIGVCPCWDSVSLNVYDLTGLKVGTFGIIANLCVVLIELAVLRRRFGLRQILQIPLALLFGTVVNFVYYDLLTFEVSNYLVSFALLLVGYAGIALFVGFMTAMDVVTTPAEGCCYVLNREYGWSFSKLRMFVDIACVSVSLLLTFSFGLSLKIREGTVIGMLITGPMMGLFMRFEEPLITRVRDTLGISAPA